MTTIITKNGSGAPTAGQLSEGELAVDLTNKELYTKSGSTVIKIGGTGGGETGTFTDLTATSSFTSPGIDDNATSTAITIDANENVGIGTPNPQQVLEIASTTDPTLRIFNRETALSYNTPIGGIEFFTNDLSSGGTGVGSSIRSYAEGNFGSNQQGLDLRFSTRPSGSGAVNTERMRIDSSGNVGINETTPAAKLDVKGPANSTVAYIGGDSDAAPNRSLAITGSNNDLAYTLDSTGASGLFGELALATNGNEAMRIDSSGNVITGSTTANASDAVTLRQDGTALVNNVQVSNSSGSVGGTTPSIYSPASATLAISTNSTERMRINGSGNVGIGTTDPSFALGTGLHIDSTGYTSLNLQKGTGGGGGHIIDFSDANNTMQYRIGTNFNSGGENLLFASASGTAMTIDASGHAIIPAGVTLGTSAGVYDAAKTLDDYEEGTWTPTVEGVTSGLTYTSDGWYTIIGDVCHAWFYIDMTVSSLVGSNIRFNVPVVGKSGLSQSYQGGKLMRGDALTAAEDTATVGIYNSQSLYAYTFSGLALSSSTRFQTGRLSGQFTYKIS